MVFSEVCRVEELFGVTTTLKHIFKRYEEAYYIYEVVKLTRWQARVREFILETASATPKAEEKPFEGNEDEDDLYSEPFGEFNLLVEYA